MDVTQQEMPICDYCGETVTDRFWYEINGDVICRQCLNENFRREADDGCADEGDEDE